MTLLVTVMRRDEGTLSTLILMLEFIEEIRIVFENEREDTIVR